MSWIAKNDITGKTYGKPFVSIYDFDKKLNEKKEDLHE